ncbi:Mini-ribonuclease 3 [Acetobacterium wieringae]|uniref:Mini-ribonuclease 3 n=1 Tax=Acetobacterium wieringae TaxID=52694 RepID=A0A1F2PLA8_9FIRM|nr:ribonuclease III domain-containing protein [Acetobacterium wieringae]OFV72209.1 mini-ribonuclease 3 [Acetobacterium wieringae]TYC84376.1 ribonuclease III [Acetobacterium wieringae]
MEKSLTLTPEPTENLKTIKATIEKSYTIEQAAAMNPLALAYLGDGIYSDMIRKYLLGCGHQNVNFMTKTSIHYVRASAQAQIIRELLPELTEAEQRIFKRGRNTASQVPKNANPSDYRYATGFETLIGYLFLCGETERMNALIVQSIAIINQSLN